MQTTWRSDWSDKPNTPTEGQGVYWRGIASERSRTHAPPHLDEVPLSP